MKRQELPACSQTSRATNCATPRKCLILFFVIEYAMQATLIAILVEYTAASSATPHHLRIVVLRRSQASSWDSSLWAVSLRQKQHFEVVFDSLPKARALSERKYSRTLRSDQLSSIARYFRFSLFKTVHRTLLNFVTTAPHPER